MILTQPALEIIRDLFPIAPALGRRPRKFGRTRYAPPPFSSQAYPGRPSASPGERAGAGLSATISTASSLSRQQ